MPEQLLTGQTLARRYHLKTLLGTGGMGQVYLAEDRGREKREVAVKILKDRETVDWFKREFETLSLMVHPHIATVYDFAHDRERNLYFYTCEYVDGRHADEALEDTEFETRLEVFIQVLHALQYIHGQGYLHCDMKPKNVLVRRNGDRFSAKVLDFGLAMAAPRSAMTARGTLSYMAPEWLEGGVPGAYTDLYSTGIMFFESTYGRLPFEATDTNSCIEFHTKGEMHFPDEDEVPDWWPKVMAGMTTKEIPDRHRSVRDTILAINRLGNMEIGLHHTCEAALESGLGGPWLGRSSVLNETLDNVQATFQGAVRAGTCTIIRGEDGVGKSRFLSELKRRMQLEGVIVIGISGKTTGRGTLVTLTALLDRLAGGCDEGAPAQERVSHMVARITDQILKLACERRLLFLLDDLSHQDEHVVAVASSVLNTLEFDASDSAAPQHRIAVVASLGSSQKLPPLLSTNRLVSELKLTLLDRSLSSRVMQLALGIAELPEELHEEAWAACGGNPRLLHELSLFLKDCGCLEFTPTGLVFHRERLPAGGYPQNIEQFVQQGWESLGDNERDTLTVLSLLFVPQSFAVLAEIIGTGVWQIDQIVAELSDRGLVSFTEQNGRSYPVVESETIRHLVVCKLTDDDCQSWHQRLAKAFAGTPRAVLNLATVLSFHSHAAGDTETAREHAITGADNALRAFNFERALRLAAIAREVGCLRLQVARVYADIYRLWGKYDDGIQLLVELSKESTATEELHSITLSLCELYFRSGEYREAQHLLVDLVDKSSADTRGRAQALLARVLFFSGAHEEARKTGEQGMLALPADSNEFALCAAMVGLVRVYEGKLQQGAKFLETAHEILQRTGTGSDRAFAANAVGLAYHKQKGYDQAREYYQMSLDVARLTGDTERITAASLNLSVVNQETGDYGQAIARYEDALAMAYQSQNQPVLAKVYNNLGNIHRYLGMLQKARDFADRSIALADRLELGLAQGLNRLLKAEIHLLQGRFEEAEKLIINAHEKFETAGAIDEKLECDIDRIELENAREDWEAAIIIGVATVAECHHHKLRNHHLRALLATAHAHINRNSAEDPGCAAALLEKAGESMEEMGNAELEFKMWALRSHAYTALGQTEKAHVALRRSEQSLARLRQELPSEYQAVFFKRPDRKRILSDFSRVSSRMAQLAQTISPSSPVPLSQPHKQRWMHALIRLNERLVSESSLEKLLEVLIDVIVDLSGAERGFVILGSQSGLDVVVARNMDREAIRRSRSKFSTSIARRVLESGELVLLADAIEADDFRSKRSVLALRIRSVICLPINTQGETIGAIYLDNRFKPGVFTESVIEMLHAFSEQAAIAVRTSRLLAQYRSSVGELKASREEVERLNRQLEEKVRFQELVIDQKTEELQRQQEQLEERYGFTQIVGRSPQLQKLFAVMRRVCQTHVAVLVTGESGSGKELVARALHYSGPRRKQRFLSINCAALPDTLLESELFGHEEGAFTDARRQKKGMFALADQGSIFLDEVGDMSLTMQAKLLRVLQEGEFTPLGAEEVMKVDVRVIAATNRDLKALVKEDKFRQDLYYRLDVVSVKVPPLRQRRDDIPLLIDYFLDQYAATGGQEKPRVSMQAMQILIAYDWPGNVRELHSVVTTAAVFADGGVVTLESLRTKPEVFSGTTYSSGALPSLENLELRELEKHAIVAALTRSEGNKQQAARVLGISRRALYNKLEAYGLKK